MQQDEPGILTTGKLRGDIRKLCGQGSHGRFILPDGNPGFLCSQRLTAQPLFNGSGLFLKRLADTPGHQIRKVTGFTQFFLYPCSLFRKTG